MKTFTKLYIVCAIMMMGIVSSCAPSSDSGYQRQDTNADARQLPENTVKKGTITDVEIVHKHAGGFCINFAAFTYNGHRYIKYSDSNGYIMHSPDCPCHNENTGSILNSSLFETQPASSLWDW